MSKPFSLAFAFLTLSLGLSIAVSGEAMADHGICVVDGSGGDACARAPADGDQSTVIGNAGELGARVNHGNTRASTPIDKFGYCRYVDDIGPQDYFVPFRSSEEWQKFRDYPHQTMFLNHCARPFSGETDSLRFGPTSKNEGLNDTGDPKTWGVSLPFWRTGSTWPPGGMGAYTHTFNHSCYEEYKQDHCWKWIPKTCTACDSSDEFGNCTSSHEYDCTYCGDWGSTCEKRWSNWSETFGFLGVALDSDTQNPSWSGTSSRVGGTVRPDAQCTKRCVFTGHDCVNCVEEAAAVETPVCVAKPVCVLLNMWSQGGGTDGGRVLVQVMSNINVSMANWMVAINQGDCELANNIAKALNQYIMGINIVNGGAPDYCYVSGAEY